MKSCLALSCALSLVIAGSPRLTVLAQDAASATGATASVTNPMTDAPAAADLAATAGISLPPGVYVSPSFAATVKMARAGLADEVIIAFINNSAGTFNLGSDQIIYLNDLGVSSDLIAAMIQHDQALSLGLIPATASTVPTPLPSSSLPPIPIMTTGPIVQSVPLPAEVNRSGFGDALAPYGNWMNVGDYGWCWQPAVALLHRGWRPYRDAGKWLWTANGWYWASDYSWGGIVFHYGRWVSDPALGWCWCPEETWAPAWVTWRYRGDYCGWAPLPPNTALAPSGVGLTYNGSSVATDYGFDLGPKDYCFVPWEFFYGGPPARHSLRGLLGAQVFATSTAVNDIFLSADHTVVNQGLPLYRVMQAVSGDIPTVPIHNIPATAGGVQPDRLGNENGALVILHPTTQASLLAAAAPVASGSAVAQIQPWPVQPPTLLWREVAELSSPKVSTPEKPQAVPVAAPAKPAVAFPVRSSQPEPITDPIVWPRPISTTPNLMRLEWFPRS